MRICVLATFLVSCAAATIAQTDKPAKGLSDKPLPSGKQAVVDNFVQAKGLLNPWTIDYDKQGNTFTPKDTFDCFGTTQEMTKLGNECISPIVTSSTKALYVIHITDWEDRDVDKDENGAYSSSEDPTFTARFKSGDWYLYQYIDGHYKNIVPKGKAFPSIFNSTEAVLVSVSRLWRPKGDDNEAPFLTYKASATEKQAPNVAALEALAAAILNVTPVTSKSISLTEKVIPKKDLPEQFVYRVEALPINTDPLHAPFDVKIQASASAKKPAAGDDDHPEIVEDKKGKKGSGNTVASDVDPKNQGCLYLTASSKCTFSRTFSVNARQYWDVGIDIVVHGPRENKYALSTSNVVTQSHTIHSALIGTFDLSPWDSMDKYPYFQIGLPLSGSAFHMPYVGLSQPLRFTKKFLPLSIYGGVAFMRQLKSNTLQIGQTTTAVAFNQDVQPDWPRKVVYGIEVPVSSIISKVKSGVGGGKAAAGSSK